MTEPRSITVVLTNKIGGPFTTAPRSLHAGIMIAEVTVCLSTSNCNASKYKRTCIRPFSTRSIDWPSRYRENSAWSDESYRDQEASWTNPEPEDSATSSWYRARSRKSSTCRVLWDVSNLVCSREYNIAKTDSLLRLNCYRHGLSRNTRLVWCGSRESLMPAMTLGGDPELNIRPQPHDSNSDCWPAGSTWPSFLNARYFKWLLIF